MDENREYKSIGGWLIIFASWNIILPIISLSALFTQTQVKMALVLMGSDDIPDAYFTVARLGHFILLCLSLYILRVFFYRRKDYPILEIINFVIRTIFLISICYIMDGFKTIFTEFADLLALSVLMSLVTLIYLNFSERAKNTFVNQKN